MRVVPVSFALALMLSVAQSTLAADPFEVKHTDDGIEVTQAGQLVTRYLVKSGAKPVLWPIIGPGGRELTRGYPMREATAKEKQDHIHQRSFWFTHGDVNGVSFWDENPGHGDIVHREFLEVQGGETAVIVTRNDWMGKGERQCEDVRRLVIGGDADRRWIDVDILVGAPDREVVFGDTKEGSFGVRVAGSMRVELKEGGKIVNAEGLTDDAAWGKRSPWVDYSGPVDGERLGIAILNHPSSLRFPTYWHVRTYGLFAANPFGVHDFERSADQNGALKLARGESFRLRYRVLFHHGDEQEGKVAEEYARYSAMQLRP